MKLKLSIILLLASISIASQAQITSIRITEKDTVLYAFRSYFSVKKYTGQKAIAYKEEQKKLGNPWRWDRAHWQGVTITYGGLVENIGNLYKPQSATWMKQGTSSIGVDINFIDYTFLSSGCFGMFTGVGLEINNFRFDQNVTLGNNSDGYVVPDWSYRDAGIGMSKTKLTTTYIQIPLMFEFEFGRTKNIWINFGVVGGFLVDAHTKVNTDERGKEKQYRGLNINNFHYGFEASAGFGMFGLRAKYYPQSIFRPGEGPNVQQVNIGFTIAF